MKEKEGLLILAASFDNKIDANHLSLIMVFYKAAPIILLKRDNLTVKRTPQRDRAGRESHVIGTQILFIRDKK